jgi:CheY-like chemotaxis protein
MARSILLIDDDELLCDLLTDLLEMEGYRIASAGDGAQGLELLAGATFDLIILDLLMPRMDGVKFLRVLHERLASPPPVIVLSASASGAVLDELQFPGVRDVIRKPIQPGDLVARLARLFAAL